ncbi:MAG: DUF4412 domain-containing protein [Desulfobacterales bacterium]|jgi:hypothetical protein|nr:DUF4412 domain-containing protein [Desulfobacterales bacterium]
MKRFMTVLIVWVLTLAFFQSVSFADIYMKQKHHTDATQMMGVTQPAKDIVAEIWISEKGFRSDDPEHSTIMLANSQKVIMLDHKTKTYMEQPLNMDEMMGNMSEGKSPEDKAAMKQMMQNMMKMDASVTETGEQKTINNWKCRKYILKMNTAMGAITNEVWATEDLKVDKEIYEQMTNRMLASMPGAQSSIESMRKEMEKIKGVQVMTVSNFTMMNQPHKSTTELLEFKKMTAPGNIFDIPAGYKKQTMGKNMQ